jgi:hypothetical protein
MHPSHDERAAQMPAGKRYKDDPTIMTAVLPAGKRYKDEPTIMTAVLPAGKRYKDDPTIMTWEVANEPHTSDGFESSNDGQTLGDRKARLSKYSIGALAGDFICRAATFLKRAAPRQLVTSGLHTCPEGVGPPMPLVVSLSVQPAGAGRLTIAVSLPATDRLMQLSRAHPHPLPKLHPPVCEPTSVNSTHTSCSDAFHRRFTLLNPALAVPAGEEGYKATGKVLSKSYAWLDDGLKGVDFPRNARCKALDYMTVHVYPDNWEIPFWDFRFTTDTYMKVSTLSCISCTN